MHKAYQFLQYIFVVKYYHMLNSFTSIYAQGVLISSTLIAPNGYIYKGERKSNGYMNAAGIVWSPEQGIIYEGQIHSGTDHDEAFKSYTSGFKLRKTFW